MSDLEDIKIRLKIEKSKIKKRAQKNNQEKGVFLGSAFKLGTELVAAVIVGTIIGFILDSWFDKNIINNYFFSFWFCSRNSERF